MLVERGFLGLGCVETFFYELVGELEYWRYSSVEYHSMSWEDIQKNGNAVITQETVSISPTLMSN